MVIRPCVKGRQRTDGNNCRRFIILCTLRIRLICCCYVLSFNVFQTHQNSHILQLNYNIYRQNYYRTTQRWNCTVAASHYSLVGDFWSSRK